MGNQESASAHERAEKTRIDRGTIVAGLREVGVGEGDLLQVHSSLSSFGYVEGGAKCVVDALLEAVGPSGTVMVPTFNHGRADIFDVATTPSVNGAVTEALRERPEARRSVHPTQPEHNVSSPYIISSKNKSLTINCQSPIFHW